jgi:sucrose-6-phosphate hydrolase SacC (GH32 family)
MSNWLYAGEVPTNPWRSAMTVPRTLALRPTPDGLRLVQQPVAELLKLREPGPRQFRGGTFAAASAWLAAQTNLPALLDIEMSFTGITAKSAFSIQLHTAKDEVTTIACNGARNRLSVDRTRSGQTGFHRDFPGRHEAPLRIIDGKCAVRLLVDTSSLEVFAQDTAMTELIFPSAGPRSMSIQAEGEGPSVGGMTIHALKPAR